MKDYLAVWQYDPKTGMWDTLHHFASDDEKNAPQYFESCGKKFPGSLLALSRERPPYPKPCKTVWLVWRMDGGYETTNVGVYASREIAAKYFPVDVPDSDYSTSEFPIVEE